MAARSGSGSRRGPDAVRDAVEQTFEATAGSVAETRERAASLLDQVTHQGLETGRDLERRGREASAAIGNRIAEAVREIQKRLRP